MKRVLPRQQKLQEDIRELNNIKYKLDMKSSKAKEEITFFEENDDCPTCEQPIDEDFKQKGD